MKSIPRFFIPKSAINQQRGLIVYTDSNLSKQLSRVLRLSPGAKLDFLDGLGSLYRCSLQSCLKNEVTALIDKELTVIDAEAISITVALPILKGNRFEWALEKMTEIGVAKIIPLVLERSVVKPTSSSSASQSSNQSASNNRFTRWQSILKESSEQCERATIPHLVSPISFQDMLKEESTDQHSLKIICVERRASPHLAQALLKHFKQHNRPSDNHGLDNPSALTSKPRMIITIGAEGGFTEKEVDEAINSAFIPASLGPLILRSETAAIYALAIAKSLSTVEK